MPLLILFLSVLLIGLPLEASAGSREIVITEFMANPKAVWDSKGEWIEIYNSQAKIVNLKNWCLEASGNKHCLGEDFFIEPSQYLVLCKNDDSSVNGGIKCHYQYSGLNLNNSGGSLGIKKDAASYGFNYPENLIKSGYSLELSDPSSDFKNPENWHLSSKKLTSGDFGTPGEPNSQKESEKKEPAPPKQEPKQKEIKTLKPEKRLESEPESESDSEPRAEKEIAPKTIDKPRASIKILEIFPNPEGVDGKNNEYIVLKNDSDWDFDLRDWSLENKNGDSHVFNKDSIIKAGSFLKLKRKVFGFNLYNEQGLVSLLDDNRQLVYVLGFPEKAPEGRLLRKEASGIKVWSKKDYGGREIGTVNSEQTAGAAYLEIYSWEELEAANLPCKVLTKGVVIKSSESLYANSFLVKLGKGGLIAQFKDQKKLEPGRKLSLSGSLSRKNNLFFLRVEEDLLKVEEGSEELVFTDLNKQPEAQATPEVFELISFKGLVKKIDEDFIVLEDALENKIKLLNNEQSVFKEGDKYSLKGVVLKNSGIYQIFLMEADLMDSTTSKKEAVSLFSKKKDADLGLEPLKSELLKEGGFSSNKIKVTENFDKQSVFPPRKNIVSVESFRQVLMNFLRLLVSFK